MLPFLLLTTRANDRAAEGEYNDFLRHTGLDYNSLHRIRVEAGPLPKIDLDCYSGVILGGSPFNASASEKSQTQRRVEAELTTLLRQMIRQDRPFLGACYGVGLTGLALGAQIDDRYAERPGVIDVEITNAGMNDPLLQGVPNPFPAIVGHKEACSELPDGAVLLATSASCPVQMFRVRRTVYVTQFHPELDSDSLRLRLGIYANHGYCDPEEVEDILAATVGSTFEAVKQILSNFVGHFATAA